MNSLEWIIEMLNHSRYGERREKVNITAEGDDLTSTSNHDKLGHHQKHTFIFKASFRSTAVWIKVTAADEDEAWEKAVKRREVKGCTDLIFVEERD